ncbi:endonuclease domain-containing protein [Phenylobacterium sp. VNQ135]|uniref:endonuclease domain-containing protein n=1 Tax=Phenylobacterium sp. VNQ135 TaxID=3400922 RepID=UPI003C121A41
MRAHTHVHRRAKRLRAELSLPETLLWVRLRRREDGGPAFRRQHPVGPYVLDFYCAQARLCVEVDGWAHGTEDRPRRDARRDAYLRGEGISVYRIAAADVLRDPDSIAEGIVRLAAERPARPDAPSGASRHLPR